MKDKQNEMKPEKRSTIVDFSINFVKFLVILIIVPPLLNWAALNRELPEIGKHGLPYDIGMNQTLFMSCKGKGLPTVIMESPIGTSSDLWIPIQHKLSLITKV
jgi:hypothetical protein